MARSVRVGRIRSPSRMSGTSNDELDLKSSGNFGHLRHTNPLSQHRDTHGGQCVWLFARTAWNPSPRMMSQARMKRHIYHPYRSSFVGLLSDICCWNLWITIQRVVSKQWSPNIDFIAKFIVRLVWCWMAWLQWSPGMRLWFHLTIFFRPFNNY